MSKILIFRWIEVINFTFDIREKLNLILWLYTWLLEPILVVFSFLRNLNAVKFINWRLIHYWSVSYRIRNLVIFSIACHSVLIYQYLFLFSLIQTVIYPTLLNCLWNVLWFSKNLRSWLRQNFRICLVSFMILLKWLKELFFRWLIFFW